MHKPTKEVVRTRWPVGAGYWVVESERKGHTWHGQYHEGTLRSLSK
jgi:hypothetical protein